METTAMGLRVQPIDATHTLNRSAGVSKFNVFLSHSIGKEKPPREAVDVHFFRYTFTRNDCTTSGD
ncbi:hypothetical protein N9100_02020 [Gammaproteobacteria bacterium]|nr:hypothetical protein [Gammaproteobacteria bacterium]